MSLEAHGTPPDEWAGTPWEELERPGPDAIEIGGVKLRRGSRVRLRPKPGGDVFDAALDGEAAVIDTIEQDMEEQIRLAVVVEGDPGRDLGEQRQPGHRFFFTPEEVEPLGRGAGTVSKLRVLIAGIGNVFLGDDGFGVELANRLSGVELAAGIEVVDFGIRGMDLAWAMQDGYDVVVMLDAAPCGKAPGTLYLIEPEVEPEQRAIEGHGMDPVTVLSLVHALGGTPPRTLVVGCEPRTGPRLGDEQVVAGLSEPVRLALDEGVKLVETVLDELTTESQTERSPP